MTGISQQFCVRWNSHLGSLGAAFPQLLAGQQFVDVTLACDGHQVHVHRLVLAACSSYFESLLSENPCKHPIIILPKDIKLWEIHALVDFMYKGQVNVSQAGLPQLLKCAETLQIRGLCGTESSLNEVANSGKIERCDSNASLPATANCTPSNFNSFSSMFAANVLNATSYQSDDEQQQPFRQQQQQQHSNTHPLTVRDTTFAAKSTNLRSNDSNLVKTKQQQHHHHHKNVNNDKQTAKEQSTVATTTKNSVKRMSENEASNTASSSELNIKCEELDSDAHIVDDDGGGIDDDDLDDHSNSKQSECSAMQHNDSLVVCDNSKYTGRASHDTDTDSISITRRDSITADEHTTNVLCYSPSWSLAAAADAGVADDDDDDDHALDKSAADFECDVLLPTSLKFNRNTMSIFVKRTTSGAVAHRPMSSSSQRHYPDTIEDNSENIIRSPKFSPVGGDQRQSPADTATFERSHFASHQTFDELNTMDQQRSSVPATEHQRDLLELLQYKDPLRSAVVLRNPRGNQPRSYTTDALYAALMDVKSGGSIYRASQMHGVPRKTLRNWMKRWDIKSVFPMPYQLKKAAEKKRQTTRNNETTQRTLRSAPELITVSANDY